MSEKFGNNPIILLFETFRRNLLTKSCSQSSTFTQEPLNYSLKKSLIEKKSVTVCFS